MTPHVSHVVRRTIWFECARTRLPAQRQMHTILHGALAHAGAAAQHQGEAEEVRGLGISRAAGHLHQTTNPALLKARALMASGCGVLLGRLEDLAE